MSQTMLKAKLILLLSLCILLHYQPKVIAQQDSSWNVLVLKKGLQPEINDNMAVYSPTGFYLYKNCFYDLQLSNKKDLTLRLIDVLPDTLVFIGISPKRDTDLSIVSKDTFRIHPSNIRKIYLLKDWGSGAKKTLKCAEYHFIFYPSLVENRLESKKAHIYSHNEGEIIPRLSATGITYHYEFGGRLFYHSGIEYYTLKESDENKIKILNGVMTALDIMLNKRVYIPIPQKQKKED